MSYAFVDSARDLVADSNKFVRRMGATRVFDREVREHTRGGRSRKRRSASPIASSTLCVTRMVVIGLRATNSASSARSLSASVASSETNGSSSTSNSGSTANARAKATRRARPTESSPGVMAAVFGEAQRPEQRAECAVARLWRGEPHVLFDRAPGKETRFLEHDAEPAVRRQLDAAFEIVIEPDDNA